MAHSKESKKEIEAKIIAHAWKDKEFRKRLLSNPKAALEELGYTKFPAHIKVRVVEELPDTFTFVLPRGPSHKDELSESELRKIAAAGLSSAFECGGC